MTPLRSRSNGRSNDHLKEVSPCQLSRAVHPDLQYGPLHSGWRGILALVLRAVVRSRAAPVVENLGFDLGRRSGNRLYPAMLVVLLGVQAGGVAYVFRQRPFSAPSSEAPSSFRSLK